MLICWFILMNAKLYHMVNSFLLTQVTAQDISTMIRCGQRTIIFLINNGGYTIEAQIHDGPYNVIKNWDYTGLVNAIHNGEGKCWTAKVSINRFEIFVFPLKSFLLLLQIQTVPLHLFLMCF